MRPKRLELEGFGSFREKTVVEFDGAELFVLAGPTGSGKSTIIDGVTFALYGAVPRYQRSNLVRPAISNGMEEARVRLDFEVSGQEYTAARVVRRTNTGASTREARLMRGDDVLAGTSDEVSTAVETLLGLTFEHFQKCVVLPQGAFAQLLHDAHANRLALLRSLLGIEVFSRMRELANGRASRAKHEGELREARLTNELSSATDEALSSARERVGAVEGVRESIREKSVRLDEVVEATKAAQLALAVEEAAVAQLAGVELPPGLAKSADELERTRSEVQQRQRVVEAALTSADAARAEREAMPARDEMERLLRDHDEHVRGAEEARRNSIQQAEATEALTQASAALASAEAEMESARTARESAFRDNHAVAAAKGLTAGDNCPICGETLQEAPQLDEPANMKAADAAREAAERTHGDRTRVEQAARTALQSCELDGTRISQRLAEIEAALAGKPGRDEVARIIAEIAAAESTVNEAQQAWNAARADLQMAEEAAEKARAMTEGLLMQLDAARDSVATLTPPVVDRTDLRAAWTTLADWAASQLHERQSSPAERAAAIAALDAEGLEIDQELRDLCGAASIPLSGASPVEAATTALARAQDAVGRIEELIETAGKLREEQVELLETERVASTLGRHLMANRGGFEAWYVRQVVEHLTLSASETLLALSQGQFSLALAENEEFEVIDHANADARRHIRTLSGGETFLASLALALALADSIAMVAAGRTARLEAIFLDEGFGTLDSETLDVVATAIEELSASGRMVGLVTHVGELAARMPVRFEVRRGPRGSTVERVEA